MVSPPLKSLASDEACAALQAHLGVKASDVLFAPYRICPLGAHVDHQYGPVVAGAIEFGLTVAFTPRRDSRVRVYSEALGATAEFDATAPGQADANWLDYGRGAYAALHARAPLDGVRGMDAAIVGGGMQSGLSSSAAVGVAYLLAIARCHELILSDRELIELDAYIEQSYRGLNNGTLDPAAIVFSRQGRLTEIDTRENTAVYHATDGDFRFFAVFSGIADALTPANFNSRVHESWQAAREMGDHLGRSVVEDARLGDFSSEEFASVSRYLAPLSRRRAMHFFSETERVGASVVAWRDGDVQGMGELMRASAESSVENYECGATPVRELVRILNGSEGVAGARFCGPGFRGCCIGLLQPGVELNAVVPEIMHRYGDQYTELAGSMWAVPCRISDGARYISREIM